LCFFKDKLSTDEQQQQRFTREPSGAMHLGVAVKAECDGGHLRSGHLPARDCCHPRPRRPSPPAKRTAKRTASLSTAGQPWTQTLYTSGSSFALVEPLSACFLLFRGAGCSHGPLLACCCGSVPWWGCRGSWPQPCSSQSWRAPPDAAEPRSQTAAPEQRVALSRQKGAGISRLPLTAQHLAACAARRQRQRARLGRPCQQRDRAALLSNVPQRGGAYSMPCGRSAPVSQAAAARVAGFWARTGTAARLSRAAVACAAASWARTATAAQPWTTKRER